MHNCPPLEAALSRWENEGGAPAQRMQSQRALQASVPQSINTELSIYTFA